MSDRERPDFENRLENLRREAKATGRVGGRGVDVAGGPIPGVRPGPVAPGYYGKPVLKPPVWVWEISLYFFIGGLAGMAAVLAPVAYLRGHADVTRAAMWLAAAGGLLSPVLLIMDLGRPWLFLNMLRVFKPKSPMSVGSWIVSFFGSCAIPGALAFDVDQRHLLPAGSVAASLLHLLALALVAGAGFWGMFLATYTGVLIGVSAIPAWSSHHRLLPFHFGMVGLGSAVAALELLGFRLPALNALGWAAILAETFVWLWLELWRHGAADRALHEGRSGFLLRAGGLLTGPIALGLRALAIWYGPGLILSDVAFLIGGIAHRFGWIQAGHASGRDPEAAFASMPRNGTAKPAPKPYL